MRKPRAAAKRKNSAKLYGSKNWNREVSEASTTNIWRTDVSRDYGRVIHSACFRRLQGKTQVFPTHESDFFRNRLTHSLEVAQISQGIAERLNHIYSQFKSDPINAQLCAVAGLVHDLGHPPFGHNGERALDAAMAPFGGFEGNAQTLRILARLEKKVEQSGSDDQRAGLNLTYRTMACALKYDKEIPSVRPKNAKLVKGYYGSEAKLVASIKKNVSSRPSTHTTKFKTIECAIMDIADDIAYSTYDLEDCLKAGFLTPAKILSSEPLFLDRVADKVSNELKREVSGDDVLLVFSEIFGSLVEGIDERSPPIVQLTRGYRSSANISESAYFRTKLSSELVNEFVNAVELNYNADEPALSEVKLTEPARTKVEILKQYTFLATIYSSRVKLAEYKGYDVVAKIFQALAEDKGELLMPDDMRTLHNGASNKCDQMRIVCDFVAGMTDRYALEFYGRLYSDVGQSIFKPIG